jgi:hypothetical protein
MVASSKERAHCHLKRQANVIIPSDMVLTWGKASKVIQTRSLPEQRRRMFRLAHIEFQHATKKAVMIRNLGQRESKCP